MIKISQMFWLVIAASQLSVGSEMSISVIGGPLTVDNVSEWDGLSGCRCRIDCISYRLNQDQAELHHYVVEA